MNRITKQDLQSVVDRINRVTGSPMEPWTRTDTTFTANIGNYHLSWAYGGVCLERMHNDGGGVSSVISGYRSKRELYDRMQAFLSGLETERVAA